MAGSGVRAAAPDGAGATLTGGGGTGGPAAAGAGPEPALGATTEGAAIGGMRFARGRVGSTEVDGVEGAAGGGSADDGAPAPIGGEEIGCAVACIPSSVTGGRACCRMMTAASKNKNEMLTLKLMTMRRRFRLRSTTGSPSGMPSSDGGLPIARRASRRAAACWNRER